MERMQRGDVFLINEYHVPGLLLAEFTSADEILGLIRRAATRTYPYPKYRRYHDLNVMRKGTPVYAMTIEEPAIYRQRVYYLPEDMPGPVYRIMSVNELAVEMPRNTEPSIIVPRRWHVVKAR